MIKTGQLLTSSAVSLHYRLRSGNNLASTQMSRTRTHIQTALYRVKGRIAKALSCVDNNTMITFEDFKKLDIRIGKVLFAEKVAGTDKLLRMEIDFGEEKRQIVAGIAESYQPEQMTGREVPVLMNLEPRKIRGIESQGMILAVVSEGKPVLMHPDQEVAPGSIIR